MLKDLKGKKVICAMSGGVDSSVAAYLLREAGCDVTGVFMNNWDENDGVCTAAQDFQDVASVCAQLDIPYITVNFAKEYRESVFKHFLADYADGYTPNPDILCNKEIKFKVLFEKAKDLGAEYLATGHYCQTDGVRLLRGVDTGKDQSYFLSQVPGKVLSQVVFPIGGMEKSEVRAIARQLGLRTASKKDSTGICFIGERAFQPFLNGYLNCQPGPFQTLDGTTVGQHRGAPLYTPGQRRHLGLGGPGKRWYVIDKDIDKNIVYVERNDSHPALYSREVLLDKLFWIGATAKLPWTGSAKIRYRQADQDVTVRLVDGQVIALFNEPQRAVAPGQTIAFYDGAECIGSARIRGKSEASRSGEFSEEFSDTQEFPEGISRHPRNSLPKMLAP